ARDRGPGRGAAGARRAARPHGRARPAGARRRRRVRRRDLRHLVGAGRRTAVVHRARGLALAAARGADAAVARRGRGAGRHGAGARAEAGMKVHAVMDVSGLSVYNSWTHAPLWWGFM